MKAKRQLEIKKERKNLSYLLLFPTERGILFLLLPLPKMSTTDCVSQGFYFSNKFLFDISIELITFLNCWHGGQTKQTEHHARAFQHNYHISLGRRRVVYCVDEKQ